MKKYTFLFLLFSNFHLISQEWNISKTDSTFKEIAFTTDEGTWMNLDVSPDGKFIIFDLLGDIYQMPISGGNAKLLKGGMPFETQPRFSPNGKYISFTSDAGGGDNIWIMENNGENPQPITKENFRLLNNAVWSNDSQYLIARKHFSSSRSLGAGELWMYHINGGKGIQLTKRKNDQQDVNEPCVSPDGKYIYYSEDIYPGDYFQYNKDPNNIIFAIHRFNTENGKTEIISSNSGSAFRPQISPDGKKLAFIKRVRTKTVLYLKDLETGLETPLYDKLSKDQSEAWTIFGIYTGFSWMPNNKEIIIWANGKINKINIAEPNSAKIIPFNCSANHKIAPAIRFTNEIEDGIFNPNIIKDAKISPDKKWLVFNAVGHLYKKKLPNGIPERITNDSDFEFEPSFSFDGSKLIYTTWDDEKSGSIKELDWPNGNIGKSLTTQKGIYRTPSYSTDQSRIVFVKEEGSNAMGYAYTMEPGIYIKDLQKNEEKLLIKEGHHPKFNLESNKIFYQIGENLFGGINKSFHSINLNGFDKKTLINSSYGAQFTVSPDEKYIAFSHLQSYFVAPFPYSGIPIDLNKESESVQVKELSAYAGNSLAWDKKGENLFYTIGNQYYIIPLSKRIEPLVNKPDSLFMPNDFSHEIGLKINTDQPTSTYLLKNAKIITMVNSEVLEEMDILVEGNKISKIGKDLPLKTDTKLIDCTNKTIIPGFIDAHAHANHFRSGLTPKKHWPYYAALAFGTTTMHDPSANSETVFGQAELIKAGKMVGPRVFSTGTIIYGADGDFKAVINNKEDALKALKRNKSYGAFSVKSYNQPRRDQRQQIISAARELNMLVVPEGGSFFFHNMSMILDGHTTIEHNIPIAPLYNDVIQLWSKSQTAYTPTLIVNYGSISGEYYWYQHTKVWENEKLLRFTPQSIIDQRSRHRIMVPEEEYENGHILTSKSCKKLADAGVLVNTGAHGQIQGIGQHWEIWMLKQGGMSNLEALKAATINPAKTFGLADQIGTIEEGKFADLLILKKDPLEDIYHTTSIQYTMANGNLYNAETMEKENEKRTKFYWELNANSNNFNFHDNVNATENSKCSCQTNH